jgi:pheromone shutdown protein TraB
MVELDEERARRLMGGETEESFGASLRSTLAKIQDSSNSTNSGASWNPLQRFLPKFNLEDVIQILMDHFYGTFKAMGLIPGEEFRVAIMEARKLRANVVYGDRNIHVKTICFLSYFFFFFLSHIQKDTLQRLRNSLSLQLAFRMMKMKTPEHIVKILNETSNQNLSLEEKLEAMKQREKIRTIISWLDSSIPEIVEVLLHQR